MNVLVIVLDSLRPDYLGCAGHQTVRTPHIDRIAAEGTFFRNAFEPHEPWCPAPPCDTMYRSREYERYIPFPVGPSCDWMTDDDRQQVIENYMGDATHTDDQIGKVTATLERLRIKQDTLVFVLSDHGEPLCEHGTIRKYGVPVYDELAKMVFIVSQPGVLPEGVVSNALVQNVDFPATVADALDLDLPSRKGEVPRRDRFSVGGECDGLSLLPLLKGEVDEARDAAFMGGFAKRAGIRKGPWKLIDNRGEKPNELFNLEDDPAEKENAIGREPGLARELHRQLWEFETRWSVPLSWRDMPADAEP